MMVKEHWFEEMRKAFRTLKRNDLTLGQILEAKRSFDLFFNNLIRVAGYDAGINVEMVVIPKKGLLKRFWLWIKSFKNIF
jgi:hypothetical protein